MLEPKKALEYLDKIDRFRKSVTGFPLTGVNFGNPLTEIQELREYFETLEGGRVMKAPIEKLKMGDIQGVVQYSEDFNSLQRLLNKMGAEFIVDVGDKEDLDIMVRVFYEESNSDIYFNKDQSFKSISL